MSLVDQIYDGMKDDIEIIERDGYDKSDSEIDQFFAGQTLFISGVTGYLGKCLLEKLLRSCSDIRHIYILMREHKGKLLEERMEKYFDNVVFKRLREEHPDFKSKVTIVKGDLMAENLGMSDEDRATIQDRVSVIYHNAANVKFDVRASVSLRCNVLGTKKMLELARDCANLKVFVYVSTAYSHLYKKDIEEQFYPPPADLQAVQEAIEADERTEGGLPEDQLQALIGKFPNIYPYSKAIAEDLVRQYASNAKFAHAIYRPSIVVSAYKEPLPGWCGNTNGPVYIFLAAALGFIRAVYHYCLPLDFVPSDLCINALIAVTRDAHVQWDKHQRQPVVYNYGSSTVNPITFVMIRDLFDKVIPPNERSVKAVWLNHPLLIDRMWLFYLLHFLLHFLPACMIDFILLLSGKKPRVLAIFWKATQHLDKIDYFGNGNWKIHMPRTLQVIDKMNAADRDIFYCDIRNFSWEEHTRITWRGLKLYILKEEIVSEAAERRYYVLWYLHYGFITLCLLAIFYMLWALINLVL
ncbi:fatty acyl-CoA reductase 1-like [Phymastichus coffea]|uniref:fatty acyl-CoA reductase 1-like n=1 Tax=Phymastichus coffea TaxID=108790 RepID=UPI00273C9514|nr:fatty acyl-CoA reductase 1-like [Phymastichus coffea]